MSSHRRLVLWACVVGKGAALAGNQALLRGTCSPNSGDKSSQHEVVLDRANTTLCLIWWVNGDFQPRSYSDHHLAGHLIGADRARSPLE